MLFCQVARGNFNFRKRSIADLRRCLKGDEEGTGKGVFIIKVPVFFKERATFMIPNGLKQKKGKEKRVMFI